MSAAAATSGGWAGAIRSSFVHVTIRDHRGFVTRWNQRRRSVERGAYRAERLGRDRLMATGIVELAADRPSVSRVRVQREDEQSADHEQQCPACTCETQALTVHFRRRATQA
jgi:hypothetical protein